jgi:hypothetical protein
VGVVPLGLGNQPRLRKMTAFADHFGDLGDLAAQNASEAGADAAEEAERADAVAEHQFTGRQAFELQAEDFVARKSGHDRHGGCLPSRSIV